MLFDAVSNNAYSNYTKTADIIALEITEATDYPMKFGINWVDDEYILSRLVSTSGHRERKVPFRMLLISPSIRIIFKTALECIKLLSSFLLLVLQYLKDGCIAFFCLKIHDSPPSTYQETTEKATIKVAMRFSTAQRYTMTVKVLSFSRILLLTLTWKIWCCCSLYMRWSRK